MEGEQGTEVAEDTRKGIETAGLFERVGLLGRKVGMTQVFDEEGRALSVTVIEVGPCVVVQVKTKGNDGYSAVQIGYEQKREKRTPKPQQGHFKKVGLTPMRYLREFRLTGDNHNLESGQQLTIGLFEDVKKVDVTGTSKGRGFAGTIKRWNFHRGPGSHGSHNVRQPGSIGCSADPARVVKGKKMPGHMGAARVTVRNLRVVQVRAQSNAILVEGGVPGADGGLLEIRVSR